MKSWVVATSGTIGVLELADLGLEGVAAVEEHHFVARLLLGLHELGAVPRAQMRAAAHDAVCVHLELARGAEGDDLVADLDAQPGEVRRAAVGPLHVDAVEAPCTRGWS